MFYILQGEKKRKFREQVFRLYDHFWKSYEDMES